MKAAFSCGLFCWTVQYDWRFPPQLIDSRRLLQKTVFSTLPCLSKKNPEVRDTSGFLIHGWFVFSVCTVINPIQIYIGDWQKTTGKTPFFNLEFRNENLEMRISIRHCSNGFSDFTAIKKRMFLKNYLYLEGLSSA